jgi:CheY-like chemotaxis protein
MAKIVVVEDEPDLREILVDELSDLGHEVHTASNGVEGLSAIQTTRPELILADINMPKMNGYEMRQRLMDSDPELAKRPFIFVSAYADKSDIADGLMLGADHYVTKPIDFAALHGWIQSLLR